MARPRIWQPFQQLRSASSYEFTDAGDIRDQHRNVIPIGASPDYAVNMRLYDTARKMAFPRREVLALEFFGLPPAYRCVICDKRLPTDVLHLNGNPKDFSRDNLKWGGHVEARHHELNCIHWAMTHNDVPPRIQTQIRDKSVYRINSMPKKSLAEAERRNNER